MVGAGCAGGDTTTRADDATVTVESADGNASLTIDPSALPDGVTVDDLALEWSEGLFDEPGAPFVGVRLEPDGLSLSAPATVRVTLPGDVNQFIAIHQSAEGFEIVDLELEVGASTTVASVAIAHFSTLAFHEVAVLEMNVTADPAVLAPGTTQTVTGEIANTREGFRAWVSRQGPEGQLWILVEFEPVSIIPGGEYWGKLAWVPYDADEGPWSPVRVVVEEVVDDISVTVTGQSRCDEANPNDPVVYSGVPVRTAISVVGTPIKKELMKFAGGTGNDPTATPIKITSGTEVVGSILVRGTAASDCTAAAGEGNGTTTTTTSAPPDPGDGSQPDPEGDSGNSGTGGSADSTASSASDILSYNASYDADEGCYIFTMKVAGDGEAATKDPLNKWYNPRISVNSDYVTKEFSAGGFEVDITWNRGEEGDVRVSNEHGDPIVAAAVTTEWLDESTLQVIVKNVGDVPIENSRVELSVRYQDADGNTTDTFGDDAFWESN